MCLSPLAGHTFCTCTASYLGVLRADASCALLHPSRYTTSGCRPRLWASGRGRALLRRPGGFEYTPDAERGAGDEPEARLAAFDARIRSNASWPFCRLVIVPPPVAQLVCYAFRHMGFSAAPCFASACGPKSKFGRCITGALAVTFRRFTSNHWEFFVFPSLSIPGFTTAWMQP